MEVRLKVEDTVHWYHHLPNFRFVVDEGTTVSMLLALLGVEPTDGIVYINGRVVDPQTLVCSGDNVIIRRRGEDHGPVSD